MNIYHLDDIPDDLKHHFEPAPQLGLEATPEAYVARMVEVFREVRRVLRDDGTLWLNIGDSYAGGGNYRGVDSESTLTSKQASNRGARGLSQALGSAGKDWQGCKPKDLVGIPWLLAFALRADGWYLRSDIIWAKPNPMPESVTDRPTKAHEYLFLLSKNARYFYDAEAVKETGSENPITTARNTRADKGVVGAKEMHGNGWGQSGKGGYKRGNEEVCSCVELDDEHYGPITMQRGCPRCGGKGLIRTASAAPTTRNRRTVWTIATQPYAEAHFATFPEALVEPCIKAGTSERGCCPACGKGWERVVERGELVGKDRGGNYKGRDVDDLVYRNGGTPGMAYENKTTGWSPACTCPAADPVPATILDPFSGSGTTGAVAVKHGRSYIGLELNPAYVALSHKRIGLAESPHTYRSEAANDAPLFQEAP